ncbi:uncharacterized protein BKA78DRAFT_295569 [Phyllosticta capitalensis]|uniref:uncharacterized protein n=1 Tax=Phyllosticta capitalensis TaxID=121624 RepID=UPI003131590C
MANNGHLPTGIRPQNAREEVQRLREVEELFEWQIGENGPVHRPSRSDFDLETAINNNSVLYQLPVELAMIVDNHLNNVDRLNFLMSSKYIGRKMRLLIPENKPMSAHDMLVYTKHRLRDAYNLASQLELFGRYFDDARACGGCQETHPHTDFSEQELEKPPSERRCLGLTGSIYICDHVKLRWEDLPGRMNRQQKYLECQHADHLWSSERGGIQRPVGSGFPFTTCPYSSQLAWQYKVLLPNDGQDSRTMREWSTLFNEQDFCICPHFNLLDLTQALQKKYEKDCRRNMTHYYGNVPPDARIAAGRRENDTILLCPRRNQRSGQDGCSVSTSLIQYGHIQTAQHPGPYVQITKHLRIPKFCNSPDWRHHLVFTDPLETFPRNKPRGVTGVWVLFGFEVLQLLVFVRDIV